MSLSRRTFLKSGLGGAGGWLAASGARVSAATPAEDPYASQAVVNPDPRQRLVIVNADDLVCPRRSTGASSTRSTAAS
jgi:hypothetical protein